MIRFAFARRVAVLAALLAGLAVATAPSTAQATGPCQPDTPCHNNFAEIPVMLGLGADAWVGGLVAGIANATYVARDVRPSRAWAALGGVFGAYNLAIGTWALTSFAVSRARWGDHEADRGYQALTLGVAVPSLVLGIANIALAIAGQTRSPAGARRGSVAFSLTGSGRADAPGLGVHAVF